MTYEEVRQLLLRACLRGASWPETLRSALFDLDDDDVTSSRTPEGDLAGDVWRVLCEYDNEDIPEDVAWREITRVLRYVPASTSASTTQVLLVNGPLMGSFTEAAETAVVIEVAARG